MSCGINVTLWLCNVRTHGTLNLHDFVHHKYELWLIYYDCCVYCTQENCARREGLWLGWSATSESQPSLRSLIVFLGFQICGQPRTWGGGLITDLKVIIGLLQSSTQRSLVVNKDWLGCLPRHVSKCVLTEFQRIVGQKQANSGWRKGH